MKRFLSIFIVAVALVSLASCKFSSAKKSIIGAPYEVVMVCDDELWDGPLGTELRELFQTPVEMINQEEPMFDVIHLVPRNFTSIYPSHRNILKVVCSPNATTTAAHAEYDVVAEPQIVVTFQGPTVEAMVDYLKENGKSLMRVFEIAERDRTVNGAKAYGATDLENDIKRQFGIEMHLLRGYTKRNANQDFLWASLEYPVASQGFFIYTHPFAGKESITTEALVKARNQFASRIPGPSEGSYMTTLDKIPNIDNDGYVEFVPERKVVRINGCDWVELRGFWEVEGDFMGGPFVSYTTLDKATNKLITIDCYVFSPKDDKRNLLRSLEHLIYGVSFTTQK